MARPIDADPNDDFWCGYCGKDVNENRDPGGYYIYCSQECADKDEKEINENSR
jgi:hypothetical protein